MSIARKNSFFPMIICMGLLFFAPLDCLAFQPLDIFYSNDIGGHTEPCG